MSFDISKLTQKVDFGDGEWVDDIDDNPCVRLKVRSSNFKPYRNALKRASEKAGRGGLKDTAFGEIMADHLLTGWDFSDGAGPLVLKDGDVIVDYNPEIAKAVLSADDDYGIGQKFRLAVVTAAGVVEDRLATRTKEASGN